MGEKEKGSEEGCRDNSGLFNEKPGSGWQWAARELPKSPQSASHSDTQRHSSNEAAVLHTDHSPTPERRFQIHTQSWVGFEDRMLTTWGWAQSFGRVLRGEGGHREGPASVLALLSKKKEKIQSCTPRRHLTLLLPSQPGHHFSPCRGTPGRKSGPAN